MKIHFLGATGTVTGSKYLLELAGKNILVDCGLFQGLKALRLQNWEPFAISPAKIDCVILTHAHLDHSGYLPRLVANGFRGKIYATPATRDLCQILLLDSAKIQEEDAQYANKRGFSKHHPALPLYNTDDATAALKLFRSVEFHHKFDLAAGYSFEFGYAGHILGAAHVKIHTPNKFIVFTGDVGRLQDPLMHAPELLDRADVLIVESTYGDRLHDTQDPLLVLGQMVDKIIDRQSTMLIPAFAVGRAQQILFYINKLKETQRIPDIPVYLDSPMATDVTKVYSDFPQDHKLSLASCRQIAGNARYIQTPEQSHQIDLKPGPQIIISASGMATGGRVLHHIKALAPDPENLILFTGFQAAGTRGASILAGAREIKMHGQYISIQAEVEKIESLSAHADYRELITWLGDSQIHPEQVFITHGEPSDSEALSRRLHDEFHWNCRVPLPKEWAEINE